ncbi:hypothetical protein SAMN05216553_108414 [Lentzea fradiae]|uniref:AAA ATPase domain-containing protein n=1 Tax=Lentzea fradiae TaxID=200378 RepID=A0A1G7UV55_9PSEU|nr:hypothetical protein SAMN05216553_108414 [Lentzea fradiae]
MTARPDLLVDRDREQDVFRRTLDDLGRGRSSVLVVEGQVGMGTGALVRRGCGLADEAGVRVAYARGSRFESNVDFGLASQLSAQVIRPGRPRWGNDLAAVLCEEVIAEAKRSPLLVAVDDAHFIDSGSARWLSAVTRRMSGLPLMFLLGVSSGTDREHSLRLLAERVLEPGPLTPAGTRRVLESALGEPLDDEFADEVARATGHTPGVVHTVAHRMAAAGLAADRSSVVPMRAMAADALGERLSRILDSLPGELVDLVRTMAVCEGNLDFELVCSVAGLEGLSAAHARSRLWKAGLVTLDRKPVPADWVPVDRLLTTMSFDERERTRAVVAGLCHRSAVPDGAVAGILPATRPVGDRWAVDVLSDTAARCTELGDTATASRLLRRALREPVSGASEARILYDLGEAELAIAPFASDRHLARVVTASAGPVADVLRVRAADLVLARGDFALVQRLTREVRERDDVAPDARARLLALHWLSQDRLREVPETMGRTAFAPLPGTPDDPAQAAAVAWRLAVTGRHAGRVRALARMALRADGRDECPLSLRVAACVALDVAGRRDEAVAGLDAVVAGVRLPHDRAAVGFALLARVGVSLRHGRADEAARDLAATLRTMPEHCWHPQQRSLLEAMRLLVGARKDEIGPGHETAGEGCVDSAVLFYARGLLLLDQGDVVAASAMLLECGRLLLNAGVTNPLLIPWRPAAATALRACEDAGRAGRLQDAHDALVRTWFAADAGGAVL